MAMLHRPHSENRCDEFIRQRFLNLKHKLCYSYINETCQTAFVAHFQLLFDLCSVFKSVSSPLRKSYNFSNLRKHYSSFHFIISILPLIFFRRLFIDYNLFLYFYPYFSFFFSLYNSPQKVQIVSTEGSTGEKFGDHCS